MKKIIIFATMFFALFPTLAQNVVYRVSSVHPDKSIIRSCSNNSSILYYSVGNQPYFAFLNDLNDTLYQAPLDANLSVEDFVVFQNDVYFCGSYNNNNLQRGIVGHFSFSDFFSNGHTYQFYLLNRRMNSTMPAITNITRLKILSNVAYIHLFLVSEDESLGGVTPHSFIDVAFHAITHSIFATSITDVAGIEYFDDVAVTNQYVVSVARKYPSHALYLRFFDRPGLADKSILAPSSISHKFISAIWGNDIVYQPCRAVGMENGKFAVVDFSERNGLHGVSLGVFNGLSGYSEYFLSQGQSFDSRSHINDICYNPIEQTIYVQQTLKTTSPSTFKSVVSRINTNSLPVQVSSCSYSLSSFHSLCILPGTGVVSSGGDVRSFSIMLMKDFSAGGCFNHHNLSFSSDDYTFSYFSENYTADTLSASSLQRTTSVSPIPVSIACGPLVGH